MTQLCLAVAFLFFSGISQASDWIEPRPTPNPLTVAQVEGCRAKGGWHRKVLHFDQSSGELIEKDNSGKIYVRTRKGSADIEFRSSADSRPLCLTQTAEKSKSATSEFSKSYANQVESVKHYFESNSALKRDLQSTALDCFDLISVLYGSREATAFAATVNGVFAKNSPKSPGASK